jgi:hypothetical protein
MNTEQRSFLCSLRRQHRLLWLLRGVGFALSLCSKLVQEGAIALGLLVGLLAVYYCAGQWAANLVARLVLRSGNDRPTAALFSSSVKIGALFSILSIVFHLMLLVMLGGTGALDVRLHVKGPILLRAAILPFLTCLGAACTVSGTAPADELGSSSLSHPVRQRKNLTRPSR